MNVWVVTFEELNNYSHLIGAYDSRKKARAAAKQYLEDLGLINDYTDYGKDDISEGWSDKNSDNTVIIERTKIM